MRTTSELESSVSVDTEIVADELEAVVGEGLRQVDEPQARRAARVSWKRVLAYGILPGLALILAMAAGYLKWQGDSARLAQTAAVESVQVATESTVALLSYRPDTVEKELVAARDRLTGTFLNAYVDLTDKVVIPGSKESRISAVATVPAAASVSANESHAVVLVFVNQNVTVGDEPPSSTASSVKVTLDKVGDRWLISQFDPV
jgi:Mce-associated membrane protein